jgi:hypothetical protein
MESLLPTTLSGSSMLVQSWNGDGVLADDPWSASMTAFLTASCKLPADLHVAQSVRPERGARCQRRRLQGGWRRCDGATRRADRGLEGRLSRHEGQPGVLGGKDITKGDFGADSPTSYLWIHGDEVYDIETSDETIATCGGWPGCPTASASAAPVSSGASSPAASCAPGLRIAGAGGLSVGELRPD